MHNLPRYYRCVFICESCAATQDYKNAEKVLSYGNLLESAPWRLTLMTHGAYMLSDGMKTPWTAVTGFHVDMIWRDMMHVVYQGVGLDFVGSLCVDLYLGGDLGFDNSTDAFKSLFLKLRDWCIRHKISPPVKKLTAAALGVAT